MSKIKILILFSLIFSLTLFADAPYEEYHVAFEDISKEVLKNTIGILTINSGTKKGTKLKTFTNSKDKFIFDKTVEVKETTPISNFGYHPPIEELYIENYRYPIVARIDDYLQIVYEPKRNLKTWVNLKEVQENFYGTDVVMTDSIKIPNSFFVDIFYFTKSGKRKVYKEPKKDADFVVISKDNPKYSLLSIIEQNNGFVKIGIVSIDYDTYKESCEPIGWIKIRDDKGRLTIWIKYEDLC